MKKYVVIAISCLSFLGAGCDHYSSQMAMIESPQSDVTKIAPASGGDMTFRQYLAKEYFYLAQQEQDINYDFLAAKTYFEKYQDLSNGKMVTLNSFNKYKIDEKQKAELNQAQEILTAALKNNAIPENRLALAKAHSRFDCWVDEAEEHKSDSRCKAEFNQAIGSLFQPPALHQEINYQAPLSDHWGS